MSENNRAKENRVYLGLACLAARLPQGAPGPILVVYVDALGAGLFCLGHIHIFLYLGSEAVKGLVNVDIVFGRNLKERDAEFVGELLSLLHGDSALLFSITFISD